MSIPLAILLYVYIAIVCIIAALTLLVLIQTLRFGLKGAGSYATSIAFIVAMVLVIGVTAFSIRDVDWSSTMTIDTPSLSTSTGDI